MTLSSSATQLPETVSVLAYFSTDKISSSVEPPHCCTRMRTPKPMSWSFTRNVHRSVEPFDTWYVHVCSVLAPMESSSAPWIFMPLHCSSWAAMSSVSRAEPFHVWLPTIAFARTTCPAPRSQAVPAPCRTAAVVVLAFSATTFVFSARYVVAACTRSDSAISFVLLFIICMPRWTRSLFAISDVFDLSFCNKLASPPAALPSGS